MCDDDNKIYAFNLVGLGGSFDHLHAGHQELLRTAFRIGKHVAIALTTEKLLKNKDFKEKIQSYSERETKLRQFIEKQLNITSENYTIIPLTDPFGPAITDPKLEAHVSSIETYQVSIKINEERIKNGLKPLILVIIPLVMGQSGKKLSSTDIRSNLT